MVIAYDIAKGNCRRWNLNSKLATLNQMVLKTFEESTLYGQFYGHPIFDPPKYDYLTL